MFGGGGGCRCVNSFNFDAKNQDKYQYKEIKLREPGCGLLILDKTYSIILWLYRKGEEEGGKLMARI